MPMELPVDLTPELVPFSWLLGTWEGVGMLGEGEAGDQHIFQRAQFADTGLGVMEYRAQTWLAEEDGTVTRPLAVESGFWQLDRPLQDGDGGPGMVAGDPFPTLRNADDVEEFRSDEDGFAITASINHPRGISELYYGHIKGPQISLSTDYVMRSANSRQYAAATRIFGLVNGQLFWRWDVSAGEGDELKAHASAALSRVDAPGSGTATESPREGTTEGADASGPAAESDREVGEDDQQ